MIKRLFSLLTCVILLTHCGKDSPTTLTHGTTNEPVETAPPVQKAISVQINDVVSGMFAALPQHYNQSGKTYPLLVSLHGAGQIGNGGSDLPLLLNDGIPRLLSEKKFPPRFTVKGQHFSFIILSPQFNRYPSLEEVEEFLLYAKKNYRVDPTRIYLAGLSMGGFISSRLAGTYPSEFAAIIPISGAENDPEVCKNIAEGKVPVWAFHNKEDPQINVAGAEKFISLINGFNPVVRPKLTIFNARSHDAWSSALNPLYKEDGLNAYEWMLQYSR